MDYSTGEQPDASAPPEGSGSGPQAQQQQLQRVSIHKPFTQSRVPPDLPMHPAPRHITEEELRVLEGCLHRWRSEVENDSRGTNTHACKHMLTLIQPDFCFLVALYIYMFLSGVCQICRPVYLESTEPLSLCILTSPWCRWEGFSDRFRNDPKMSSYCSWWCVSGAIPAACCFGPRGSG